ncbi:MAG: TonB family protein [Anaerolineae bacterium]|nr:TonB family protein [Phycisphaerae bacterium]
MPPRSRNIIIGTTTIAFCASLTLHAFVVVTAVDLYAHDRIFLPGFDRNQIVEAKSDRIVIPLPPDPEAPEPDRDEKLGRADGTGSALDDSPGELPLIARQGAQNQALLSRDPQGPGRMHSELSDSVLRPGSPAVAVAPAIASNNSPESRAAQKAVEESIESPEERAIPFGIGPIDDQKADAKVDRPATPAREAQPEVVAVESTAMPVAASPVTQDLTGQPGSPNAPADPAPQSDTESDPFTVIGGAQFRPGGTKAQLGRAHRLTYPRIGMAGMVDSVQLGRARLVLQLTIDQSGNVKSAMILKSSGSDNIDQACRVAAYQWWFEPKTTKDAKPLREETFLFLVSFS